MFKSLANMLSLSLQGTLFESRHKQKSYSSYELLMGTLPASDDPPYVLCGKDTIIKNDLISKLHTVDNRLHFARNASRLGRARWCPDIYEQSYDLPDQVTMNPQIEVYTHVLGLSHTRELSYGE